MVASDEESLVRFEHPDYCNWRFSERTFSALDHLFAWGADDAEMLRTYPGRGAVEVHATGNPRMDLLRSDVRELFRPRADALRREHGSFVMINTNFSFVNNFVPSLNLIPSPHEGPAQVSRTGHGMRLPFALSMAEHQRKIFDAFRALLPALARALPERTIVLRPHPSEDHKLWAASAAGIANVRVVHEGNVIPWLMACGVLVHNGCTTAVEGAMMEVPSVSYQPVRNPSHDYHLPNALSVPAYSADDVVSAVRELLDSGFPGVAESTRHRLLARHVEMSPHRLAADRIVDVLESSGYLSTPPPLPGMLRRGRSWAGTHLRTLIKRLNMRRHGHRNSAAYQRHRFPPVDAGELATRLSGMSGALGRFNDVRRAHGQQSVLHPRLELRGAYFTMTLQRPVIVAEIGCNHKGDPAVARQMIEVAARYANADYVKFQKRNNTELLSRSEYLAPHPVARNSYGATYGEHREFLELDVDQHRMLMDCCRREGIGYATSVWDSSSARQMIELQPDYLKVPSACNLDFRLLDILGRDFQGDIHLSLGMTTPQEQASIVAHLERLGAARRTVLYACTSGYPVPFSQVCLLELERLRQAFANRVSAIGFSGHHLGIAVDAAAIALGAQWVERHFTLDRTWKGTDHAASLEPEGLRKLVRDVRAVHAALTYKETELLEVEIPQRLKLKRPSREPAVT